MLVPPDTAIIQFRSASGQGEHRPARIWAFLFSEAVVINPDARAACEPRFLKPEHITKDILSAA
jgi:hypothetical protein